MRDPRHPKVWAILASVVASLLVGALPLSAGEPAEVGMEAAPLAEISKRMQEFIDRKEISGAVTLVARQGKVVHLEAVGHADLEGGRPMKKDTIFAIASMTKPITATAVMILRDEVSGIVTPPSYGRGLSSGEW